MKKYLPIVSWIFTILIVFLAIKLLISDHAMIVVPGWHTTIYTGEDQTILFTTAILAGTLITNYIHKVIKSLLNRLNKF